MSVHTISPLVDFPTLIVITPIKLGRGFDYDGKSTTQPTQVTFTPDLTPSELVIFNQLLDFTSSIGNFNNLPNWATWTATDAETNINNSIFAGQTATQVKANITSTLTDITTANVSQINARLAVIRTLLGNAVDAIIAIRGILAAMGKALVYLRNLIIKLR